MGILIRHSAAAVAVLVGGLFVLPLIITAAGRAPGDGQNQPARMRN